MKEKKVNLEKFDLQSFTSATLKFLTTQVSEEVDPSFAIVTVTAPGGIPEFGPEKGRSNFLEELKSGLLLFFPFSSSNVGDPIPCADGNSYEIDSDLDSDFTLGDTDCVGFLLSLKDNTLHINSACHAGGCCVAPPPSVDIESCDIFDAPMEQFICKFIQS